MSLGDQMEEIVKIKKSEYEEMLEQLSWLEALIAAGVDSWDGIDAAIDIYEKIK